MLGRRRLIGFSAVFPGVLAIAAQIAQAQPVPSKTAPAPAAPAAQADDHTVVARAELLVTLVETGSVDQAIAKHPDAKLTPAQVKALKETPVAELQAVLKFQQRLGAAGLPQLVLQRETIRSLAQNPTSLAAFTSQLKPAPVATPVKK